MASAAIELLITAAKSRADQSVVSQPKLNAWCSSSGRTKSAVDSAVWVQASATPIRSPRASPYSSSTRRHRR